MLVLEGVKKLLEAAPESESWEKGEPYGASPDIDGTRELKRVLYAVTPTPAVMTYFWANKYDLLVNHHPYPIKGVPQVILHTALDCCVGGMNDQWRDVLGIKNAQHFDRNLGWYGEVDPIRPDDLLKKIEAFIETPIIGTAYSDIEEIKSIVVCSGLGGAVERQAFASGADCYVIGQATMNPDYSPFKAQVEIGHTLSESKPGYLFVKRVLGEEVVVDQAPYDLDTWGGEIWKAPRYVKGGAIMGMSKPLDI